MIRKRGSEVLTEALNLAGKVVLDVGAGDGALTRLMTRAGARVTGIECSPRQLAKAHAVAAVGDERIVAGVGQALPVADASVDVVVYFNSLHHVPVQYQAKALEEARRVLKPGGILYVSEPVASGPFHDVVRLVEDETEIRARAYLLLMQLSGFVHEREEVYINPVRQRDFDSFRDRIVSANAERDCVFSQREAEIREAFERLGTRLDEGWGFDQPTRINVLRKV